MTKLNEHGSVVFIGGTRDGERLTEAGFEHYINRIEVPVDIDSELRAKAGVFVDEVYLLREIVVEGGLWPVYAIDTMTHAEMMARLLRGYRRPKGDH